MKPLLLFLSLALSVPAGAAEIYGNVETTANAVVLDPGVLREQFLANGLTVVAAANRVHQAKEGVNIARARLLPSLNLGVLLGTLANPSFLLSSVEYLFPFLIPSRWFDVRKAKNLAEAEKVGFLLTELNVFSSLYSLYFQVLSDFRTRSFLVQDFRDQILTEQLVQWSYEHGVAAESDLKMAESQTLAARMRLDRFNELLVDELASLRGALNLPLDKEILLAEAQVAANELEGKQLADALKSAKDKAPEFAQLGFLKKAAEAEKWSKVFGFFGGASAGNTSGIAGGASFAFKEQTGRASFNFGFDYFPTVSLSELNIKEIEIRERELDTELARSVEALSGRIRYAQSRFEDASAAEALLRNVLAAARQRYSLQEITLTELLDVQLKVRQASLEKETAKTDLSLLRVALHRLTRSDQFAQIRGCEALPRKEKKKKWRWPWEDDEDEAPVCDPDSTAAAFNGGSEEAIL